MRSSASCTRRRLRNPLVSSASKSSEVMRSSSVGRRGIRRRRRALTIGITDQFIEANGNGLAQIHGDIFFACGNTDEAVAVAELVVGQAEFFRPEEQRHAARFAFG